MTSNSRPPISTETALTLKWLQSSISVHNGRGSAGYFHLWRGWSAPYPETTGYIVETLWDYYKYTGDESLKQDAIACTEWLCDIQRYDGAWNGGIGGSLSPIIFDTGMILFGLTRSFAETGENRYAEAARRALGWLLALLEADGSWRQAAYVPGFIPSYYTRVVWAALYAAKHLDMQGVPVKMDKALQFYAAQVSPFPKVSDWGFRPGEPAFTHTIVYTWRGFLEAALLLKNAEIVEKAVQFGRKMLDIRARKGWLAGAFDENWSGDWSFTCVTGNAQLSVLLCRIYGVTGDEQFRQGAAILYRDAKESIWKTGPIGIRGGVPGSVPIWGNYQPFRFPNWAAKFVLDAALSTYSTER
jgi:hypothetical protein